MLTFKFFTGLTLVCGFSQVTLADHPNEGRIAISQLFLEAEKNSLEIKQLDEKLNSLKAQRSSLRGRYAPKVSLEGGPQSSRFDDEKSNGNSFYGKVEWNLYNGGQDNLAQKLNEIEIKLQEKRLNTLKNRIKNEVTKIYYELQFILESMSLKQRAIELNTQQMKIAKVKNNSGLTTSADVLEFDLRDSILASDLILLEQQMAQKSRGLDVLLSRKDNPSSESVKGHLLRDTTIFHREELIAKMLSNNEEILLVQSELQQNERENELARSQFLPRLDLEGKYGKLSNDEMVFAKNNNYSVMLKLNIPIFSGLEDYYIFRQTQAKILTSKYALQQKELTMIAELDATLAEIKALNARLDLEEKNIEKSEKYYKLTMAEYKRGTKNSPDMVVASERLLEARIKNLEYRRDLIIAKAKIHELAGE